MEAGNDGPADEPADAVTWKLRALDRDIAAARDELDSIIEATRERRERWGEASAPEPEPDERIG